MKVSILRELIFIPLMICFVSFGAHALDCSKFPGFIPVPGKTHLGTGDFCVMAYEAKAWHDANNNGDVEDDEIKYNGCDGKGSLCKGSTSNWGLETYVPASVSKGKPWRLISRDSAISECQELNHVYGIHEDSDKKFDLISNFEWQIIARDIERQSVNWSGDWFGFGKRLGSGCVYQGNNGLDTPCSYDGDNPERGANNAKARHVLSNGEFINHFPGNVWEWVKDDNDSTKVGENQYMSNYSGSDYGPEGDYSCNKGNRYCGFGFGFLEYSAGAVRRGGDWGYGDSAGLFSAYLSYDSSYSRPDVGFRCVFHSVSLGSSPHFSQTSYFPTAVIQPPTP